MIRWIIVFILITFSASFSFSQEKPGHWANKKFWKRVKKELPQQAIVFNHAEKYRFEIIYGQVNTDKTGNKKLTYYQAGRPDIYYYPASLVKFPMAVKLVEWLSFENVNSLHDLELRTTENSVCGFPIGDTARHYYAISKETMHPTDLSIQLYSYFNKTHVYDSLYHLPDSIPEGTILKLTSEPIPVHMYDVLYEMLVQSDNANYNQIFEAVAARNSNLDNLFYIPKPFIPCNDEYTSAGADFYLYNEKWKSLPGGNVQKKYDA
ncbi:MAG: hypothetical protein ACHQF2_07960, partial [Flavobacteriales bacterium]